jgi:hypothetical protein
MQPLEKRFDSIEVMLGRIVLENDRGLKRLDRLERLFERSEKRAEEDVVNYLTKRGIYAMAMGDETMELLNAKRLLERVPVTP